MNAHHDILQELELLPQWQLRQPLAGERFNAQHSVENTGLTQPENQVENHAIPQAEHQAVNTEKTVEGSIAALQANPNAASGDGDLKLDNFLENSPPISADLSTSLQPADDLVADQVFADQFFANQSPQSENSSPVLEERISLIRNADWQTLQTLVSECTACNLAQTRTQTVFGVGDAQADWLIVGEAPGAEEDKRGEPFVGQAGKLLDNMLAALQLKRGENVFILNVLKCRPPNNRDPQTDEVAQCAPFLKRQLELINPKIIVAVGKFAAHSLLQSDASIAALRGKVHEYQGVPLVVTYHPAYLLRSPMEKAKAWQDLCLAQSAAKVR